MNISVSYKDVNARSPKTTNVDLFKLLDQRGQYEPFCIAYSYAKEKKKHANFQLKQCLIHSSDGENSSEGCHGHLVDAESSYKGRV